MVLDTAARADVRAGARPVATRALIQVLLPVV